MLLPVSESAASFKIWVIDSLFMLDNKLSTEKNYQTI